MFLSGLNLRLSFTFIRGLKKSTRRVDVVLLKDHETLGKKGSVAKVRPGFARNFLYPEGYVAYATDENIIKFAQYNNGKTNGNVNKSLN